MTDHQDTPPPTGFRDPQALKRLRERHRAERRFRAYGLAAIGAAMSVLLLLVISIGSQAITAFTHYKISFDLPLEQEIVAPEGPGDTDAISENVSGFYRLVRDNLIDTFPEAGESRPLRQQLYTLVTRLAVLPMAKATADNPGRIGQTVTYRAALSDDLDLYLKGQVSDETRMRLGPVSGVTRRDDGTLNLQGGGDAFARLASHLDDTDTTSPDAPDRASIIVQAGTSVMRAETVTAQALSGPLLTGEADGFEGESVRVRIIETPESARNMTDRQIAWTLALKAMDRIKLGANAALLTNADSTYPEIAGTVAAIAGSLWTMMVTALIAVPIGIAAAVYLEEFAPKNRITDFIEVNINNLAAVPSIVFGLLGAAVFVNFLNLPRSAPLVGGLVLGLLTLPTIIIASRASLRAVPPSIRAAALGVGASQTQAVFHHVVPLAAPGILTGSIIGMARALGETAPLLLIGMVAFVAEVPSGPTDEATALPVLVYQWSTGAERAWEPNTAAAIVVLLAFMVLMNAMAVFLRRRLERRW